MSRTVGLEYLVARVHFRGGSLGGEMREMSLEMVKAGMTLHIPAYSRPSSFVADSALPVSVDLAYTTESYALRPIGPAEFEATWINPCPGLEERNHKMRDELAAVQKLLAEKDARISQLEAAAFETLEALQALR